MQRITTGTSSGHAVSGFLIASESGKGIAPRFQGSGDSIFPISSVISTSIPAHGITQLGLRSHPEKTTMTLSCFGSDKLINTITPIRPPSYSGSGRTYPFSLLESLSDLFRWIFWYLRTPQSRGEAPIWGIPRFWAPGLVKQAPYQLLGTQASNVSSTALGSSTPFPKGYDCYGQNYGIVLYQQAGRVPFPLPVMSNSGAIYLL